MDNPPLPLNLFFKLKLLSHTPLSTDGAYPVQILDKVADYGSQPLLDLEKQLFIREFSDPIEIGLVKASCSPSTG